MLIFFFFFYSKEQGVSRAWNFLAGKSILGVNRLTDKTVVRA